jgi:calcineurin-like phosphoesterase family protein
MDFITSDLHFFHKNILKFNTDTRVQFGSTVEEMNEGMITAWNNTVTELDTVYILGDISFSSAKKTAETVNRLNGKKILVAGNHDKSLLEYEIVRNCFASVHDYLEIKVNGTKVVLFHYPIYEFNMQHHGAVHCHGHVHGNKTGLEKYRVRDAGVDATGKIVVKLEDLVNDALTGEVKPHNGKYHNE